MGVIFLGLVDELTIDGVLLFVFHCDSDSLVTLVARYNPDTLFSEISFFLPFQSYGGKGLLIVEFAATKLGFSHGAIIFAVECNLGGIVKG